MADGSYLTLEYSWLWRMLDSWWFL